MRQVSLGLVSATLRPPIDLVYLLLSSSHYNTVTDNALTKAMPVAMSVLDALCVCGEGD